MESFLFAINSVMPIILTVVIGYFLKKIKFVDEEFVKKANKLVFRVFLPAMLFLNVYRIDNLSSFDFTYVLYAISVILINFFVMIPVTLAVTKDSGTRGSLLQGSFRSNYALVGIPLATSLFGAEGAMVATFLSVALIPVFNVLAVTSLTVFRKGNEEGRGVLKLLRRVGLGILKNPLIISIAIGCVALGIRAVFVKLGIGFRLSSVAPVYKVLESLSAVATPLSLIVLGAQFEFSAVKALRREIMIGVIVKGIIVPVVGLFAAHLLFGDRFGGAHFAAFVAAFATPTGVSTVPMAQEMDGNVTLSGQLVVWTTILSGFVIFIASFILKQVGIF